LIDLDLAIKEQRVKSSGARGKTGTRAFIAIVVLLDDEQHSFMHDLESFFWVLFWIWIDYNGPGKDIGSTEFECWNYESDKKLAGSKKSGVGDERDFLKIAQTSFTPYYRPLNPYVNRLRREVFPYGERWRNPNAQLYCDLKQILQVAQNELREIRCA
jgi:hypothetical protein